MAGPQPSWPAKAAMGAAALALIVSAPFATGRGVRAVLGQTGTFLMAVLGVDEDAEAPTTDQVTDSEQLLELDDGEAGR